MCSFRPFPQNRIDDVPSVSIDISDTHKLTSSDTRHPVLYRIMSIILSLNDNASGLLHTSSIDSYSFLVINDITCLSAFLAGNDKDLRIIPEYSGASTAAYFKNDFIADILRLIVDGLQFRLVSRYVPNADRSHKSKIKRETVSISGNCSWRRFFLCYQVCQEIFLQKRGKFQCGSERIILIHGHLLRKYPHIFEKLCPSVLALKTSTSKCLPDGCVPYT